MQSLQCISCDGRHQALLRFIDAIGFAAIQLKQNIKHINAYQRLMQSSNWSAAKTMALLTLSSHLTADKEGSILADAVALQRLTCNTLTTCKYFVTRWTWY